MTQETANKLSGVSRRIAIPTLEGFVFILIQDIIFCRAAGNYTQFRLIDNSVLVSSYTLKHFENVLEPKGFFRVHKSYLINLLHTKKYMKKGMVVLTGESEIEVSRTYRNDFLTVIRDYFE